MRNNQPVSNVEYALKDGSFIVSRTDTRGMITACNKDFIDASGYSEVELIGQPHNLLRHPDMPVEAFADLWATLKGGEPWHGLVKNRRKDGSYYWVLADASPLMESGQCIGYVSVRTKPKRADVEAADALYRKFREGSQGDWEIHSGQARKRRHWWHKFLPERLGPRLWLAFGVLLTALLFDGGQGYVALEHANESFSDVANRRVMLVTDIYKIREHASNTRTQILLALQHDPSGRAAAMHDHPASKHLEAIDSNLADMQKELDAYTVHVHSDAGKKSIAEVHAIFDAYQAEAVVPTRAALAEGRYEDAVKLLLKKINPMMEEVTAKVQQQADHEMRGVKQAAKDIHDEAALSTKLLIISIIASMAIMLLYSQRLIRSVTRAAKDLCDLMAQAVANGDLSLRAPHSTKRDEMSEIANVFNKLMINVSASFYDVKHGSIEMQAATELLASSADEVTRSSQAQNESAASTAAAVEEVTVSIGMVAENAAEVGRQAKESAELTHEGNRNANAMVTEINSIEQVMRQVEQSVHEFIERAHTITGMTQQVKDIADQTNLLALNAAIEAARAGEQGRGFAVVADEVRKLAERTTAATSEISSVIAAIQSETSNAITTIKAGSLQAANGAQLASQAADALERIKQGAQETLDEVSAIAGTMHEQSQKTQRITEHVSSIIGLADSNAQCSKNTLVEANQLEYLAVNLQDIGAIFKLGPAGDVALKVHERLPGVVQGMAQAVSKAFSDAVDRGQITLDDLFDSNYVQIPNTRPQKFHTRFDGFCDKLLPAIQEAVLDGNREAAYAIACDLRGYVPTHNNRFCQPLTGDDKKDFVANRTKRVFADPVGKRCGDHELPFLLQTYRRDTGEIMHDISSPVYVKGRHWGGVRIGYRTE